MRGRKRAYVKKKESTTHAARGESWLKKSQEGEQQKEKNGGGHRAGKLASKGT